VALTARRLPAIISNQEATMTEVHDQKPKGRKGNSALFIPAGLFLGMGTGWLFGNFLPGMFVGLGAGLLVFAVIMIAVRD
jgi:hypothetical protein